MADADRAAAHRGRDIAAVEVSHGASFFFCLKLQVGLWEEKRGDPKVCLEGQVTTPSVGKATVLGQYLCPHVQDQMFDHLPKGLGQPQQLIEEVVASSEAYDVHHPHTLLEGTIGADQER